MERYEREALDRHITGNYGEDQFNETVAAIEVGGEWHNVEDEYCSLMAEVTVSEQCDSCGSTQPDGTQAPFILIASIGIYECDGCGWQPPFDSAKPETMVVF